MEVSFISIGKLKLKQNGRILEKGIAGERVKKIGNKKH